MRKTFEKYSYNNHDFASLEDRFGMYPEFMLMKPHCMATFTDPCFSWGYFSKKQEMEQVQHDILDAVREEMELVNLFDKT